MEYLIFNLVDKSKEEALLSLVDQKEAMSIKFNIFPEMDFIYLFTKNDKPIVNCA